MSAKAAPSSSSDRRTAGGLKGLIQRTGTWVHGTGSFLYTKGSQAAVLGYKWGGQAAFVVATSSVLVLMPLLFEIAREGEMLEMEKLQANDLKSKGYSERQLREMGFNDSVLHTPSVASMGGTTTTTTSGVAAGSK